MDCAFLYKQQKMNALLEEKAEQSDFEALANKVAALIETGLIQFAYPVGSIYMSVDPNNPASLFGGTWTPWGSGRVPVGVGSGDFEGAETEGGDLTHTHTISNHVHPQTNHVHSVAANAHQHSMGAHNHANGGIALVAPLSVGGILTQYASAGSYWNPTHINASNTNVYTGEAVSGGAPLIGNTGAMTASVNTGNATAAFNTGNPTAAVDTGNPTTNPASGEASTVQPFITCYMWKRVA